MINFHKLSAQHSLVTVSQLGPDFQLCHWSLRWDNIKWSHSFTPVDTLAWRWEVLGQLNLFFFKLNLCGFFPPDFNFE